jgi:hypothetical protein
MLATRQRCSYIALPPRRAARPRPAFRNGAYRRLDGVESGGRAARLH